MPSALEVELDKTLTACKALTAALLPVTANVKTQANNFDKATEMYYASEDEMKDLKTKASKDPKAAVELKKWETNHPKLGARVKSVHAELEKVRGGVVQAEKSALTIRTTYNKLNQNAAKTALEDVPGTMADLKTLNTNLTAAEKEIGRLKGVMGQYDTTLKIK